MLMTDLANPPGGLSLGDLGHSDPATIEHADRIARQWVSPEAGAFPLGSEAHKRATTQMFYQTFNPYKPSIIDWPKLSDEARDRLVNLPIWDIAVQTEGRARIRMLAYAHSLKDKAWSLSIEQNGWEEGRHKAVLSNLVAAYDVPLEEEPSYDMPKNTEWAYLVTGFSECIDSFFAFGLFELAKRSAFFPPELVDTFEPVIQEECRHILLFANWLAWHRRNISLPARVWFEMRVWAAWVFLGYERMGMAAGMDSDKSSTAKPQDNNFTVNGSKALSDEDINPRDLMVLCLEENDRRFAGYDKRLVQPTTMPNLVRFALKFWPKSKPKAAA